ncbi:OmpA family protein [Ferruginibacter sp.]
MPQNLRLNLIYKKAVVTIFTLLLLQYATAQTRLGITAGGGKTSLYKFPVTPQDYNTYSGAGSWWAGLTGNIGLVKNNIDLFLSAVYNKKGYKYFLQKDNGAANTLKDSAFTQSVKYVDINLNFRKKFMFGEESPNSFFFGTGPVASILSGGSEQVKVNYFGTQTSIDNTNSKLNTGSGPGSYKPVFFSWSFSLGLEFDRLSLWLNANIPVSGYFVDAQQSIDHKIKSFGINAGYTLFTKEKKEREKKERTPKTKHTSTVKIPVEPVDSLKDSDGDGIADVNDKCPGHKGTLKYGGCPVPDSDGDGVNDDDDKCPFVAGVAANNGCPAFTPPVKPPVSTDTTCFVIYFEPAKSILRTNAYETLNKVLAMLRANSKLRVSFKGHTDYVGSEEANYKRSLERANVCAAYIASFYIDKSRLTVQAFGNKMPAADLLDPLVQWQNRRVEVCVYESNE